MREIHNLNIMTNQYKKKHKGFSLVSTMVGIGLLSTLALMVMQIFDSIKNASEFEEKVQTRTELFYGLSQINSLIDCKETVSQVPADQTIPPEGLPIGLAKIGGGVLIPPDGARRGLFSYLADMMPDRTIRIQAAAFKVESTPVRANLEGQSGLFKKSSKFVWDFKSSSSVIDRKFPSMKTMCQNVAEAATSEEEEGPPPGVQITCHTGGGTGVSQIICLAVDPMTGFFCRYRGYDSENMYASGDMGYVYTINQVRRNLQPRIRDCYDKMRAQREKYPL